MNKNQNIKKNILEQIQRGEISMKPKIFFVLKSFAVAFGLIIGTLIALFLFSFIIFTLKGSGALYLPDFGGRGLFLLLLAIPWLLIVATLALVALLETLARKFAFVYRKPVVYSVLGILLIVVFAGSAIASTPIHKKVYDRAHEKSLPLGGGEFYKHYGKMEFRGGFAGSIEAIDSDGLGVLTAEGKSVIVSTSTKTKYPRDKKLSVGDNIIVVGEVVNGKFEAFGIKQLRSERVPYLLNKKLPKRPQGERPIDKSEINAD